MDWLIIARAVQGIGGGGILQLVQIIISDIISLEARGKYMGFLGATWGIASITGPLLGGVSPIFSSYPVFGSSAPRFSLITYLGGGVSGSTCTFFVGHSPTLSLTIPQADRRGFRSPFVHVPQPQPSPRKEFPRTRSSVRLHRTRPHDCWGGLPLDRLSLRRRIMYVTINRSTPPLY